MTFRSGSFPTRHFLQRYLHEWTRIQTREIERARTSFPGLELHKLQFQRAELIGLRALERAAKEIYAKSDPAAFGDAERPLRFHTVRGTTIVSLRLPNGLDQKLDLQERDGELIVTVGGWRRHLLLPDSLRSRAVAKAWFADETLHVELEPRRKGDES